MKLVYHDGEYLQGWQAIGDAGPFLEKLGLAEWVDGWGYLVKDEVVEVLGQKFTEEDAREYARPLLEEKRKAEEERARKRAEKEARRKSMKVTIIEKGSTPGEGGSDPYAIVRIEDPQTGETGEFVCRNIFDFGYVINPNYSVVPGGTPGGIAFQRKEGDWWWEAWDGRSWGLVRPLTPFELKALEYLNEFSPVSRMIRM